MISLDHTQLSTFATCPRKFYNRFIRGIEKVRYDEREIDKDFGKCWHTVLEMVYKGKTREEAKEWWRANFHGWEGEKAKTPANGLTLIDWYVNYYASPANQLSDVNLSNVAVEVPITVLLTPDITYVAKLDRVVKSPAGIYVMEHKTTKAISNTYFYQFDPNNQLSGYCYACKEVYGQCSGIILNAISVGYREKKYQGEPVGFHAKFVREIINRNNDQLLDWKDNVIHIAGKMQETIASNKYYKNEQSCHQFKGCGFKELCLSCDDEQILETLYQKLDNPLAYLEEQDVRPNEPSSNS